MKCFFRPFLYLVLLTLIAYPLSISYSQDSNERPVLTIPEPGISQDGSQEIFRNAPSGQTEMKVIGKIAAVPGPYTVTTVADTGAGSLRKAIDDANLNPGKDLIRFNISGTGPHIIQPSYSLPDLDDSVFIDGSTQTGYSGKPLIEIDGSFAGNSNGLFINADNCTIKAIAVTKFSGVGIVLWMGNTVIEGCFIGISSDGLTKKGNVGDGLVIFSANNKIGNPFGNRNVISGNGGSGIRVSSEYSTGNIIRNTYAGIDYSGSAAVPNDYSGILIYQSSQNIIGGSGFNAMNVISGNYSSGIRIEGGLTHHITVAGNRIGTSADGSKSLQNYSGIEIIYGTGAAAGTPSDILIGGKWSEAQNLISGNLNAGVAFFFDAQKGLRNIVAGNLIGTDATGKQKLGNTEGIYIQRSDTTGSLAGVKIGGALYDSSNVISGNKGTGISIMFEGSRNNRIIGNYIGTTRADLTGAISPLGNGLSGVLIRSAIGNTIGDPDLLHGNIIGSNQWDGVTIDDGARNNTVYNNLIGTNSQLGGINLGNKFKGIYIAASNTTVGGVDLMNDIAYNGESGIYVYSGTGNRLNGNSVYKNTAMGIDLHPQWITKDDSADVDSGPNGTLNFPILDSASLGTSSTTIHGKFYSKPNSTYTLFFYKSDQRGASYFGEGQYFMDSMVVTTDDSGWTQIHKSINKTVTDDQFITALAVDNEGNTSEYSRALCLKDSDGDGIFDCWETENDGIDVNADGVIDLYLYSKGARPNHKDIFVEVDYMIDFLPNIRSLERVVEAFAKVPNKYVNNPDKKKGVHLILDLDVNSLPIPTEILPSNPWPRFFELKKQFFGTDDERGNPGAREILEAKRLVYRYCIWGDKYQKQSSGKAENDSTGVGGNDFFLALGILNIAGGDTNQQAGTFMHELGHTLGLQHGGDDGINYKPNYYSVMNYTWQFPNNDGSLSDLSWDLVYSTAELPSLNENNLNEKIGLDPNLADYPLVVLFPYADNNVGKIGTMWPNTAVDWDQNGDSTGYAGRPVDINNLNDPSDPTPGEILKGYADWPNLKYNFRKSPYFMDGVEAPNALQKPGSEIGVDEMSPDQFNYLQSLPPYGVVPPDTLPSSLLWLGTLGGDQSEATSISDDGKVVAGFAEDSSGEYIAFRWTAATGMQSLGTLGGNTSEAHSVSGDGSTIVGSSRDSSGIERAFKWTLGGGMQDLGAGNYSDATGVSRDGSVISVNVGQAAYAWSNGSMQNLGNIGLSSYAMAVSGDGTVIVGHSRNLNDDAYAVRWQNGTMTVIGPYYSFAIGVSGDGTTVTGFETGSAGLYRAFRWDESSNSFHMNIAGNFASGSDLSEDGEFLVGDGGNGAFMISPSGNLEWFNDKYSELLSPNSEFYTAFSVSADGRYVVGYGLNYTPYRDEAYILDTGGLISSGDESNHDIDLNTFDLSQNYPNPFNPSTTIRYSVPGFMRVVLTVYNLLGQRVTTLVDEEKSAGKYEMKWNAAGLSSGIYFYQIRAGNFVTTKKMILMK